MMPRMSSLKDPPRPTVEEKLDVVITKLDGLSSKVQLLERRILAMTKDKTTSKTHNSSGKQLATIALATMPKEYAFLTPSVVCPSSISLKKKVCGKRLGTITLVLACVALISAIVSVSTSCWLKIKDSCHVGIFGCEDSACGNVVEGTEVFMVMGICMISGGTISILWRVVNYCPGILCIRKGAAASLLVGGTMVQIAIIVYGTKYNIIALPKDSESSGLGYSYFLAAVAGFFALVTGIIVCIDASIRVKKRQPVLNSEGFGEFNISKYIKDVFIEEGESETSLSV